MYTWINVKDKLPFIHDESVHGYGWPMSNPVLVYCDGVIRVATYEAIYEDSDPVWYSNCSENWQLSKVTHWMELPLPPVSFKTT